MNEMKNRVAILVVAIAIIAGVLACGTGGLLGRQESTPTATKTPKPTFTATPIATDTPIPTDTPLPTDTPTPVPPTNTPIILTATPTPLPTDTPTPIPPTATKKPTAKPTSKPKPTATKTSIPPTAVPQYKWTGQVVWNPAVAPNCAGPGVSSQSIIKDKAGAALNGILATVDCYGNKFLSFPSGPPAYTAGHYDFSLGQTKPQAWTCTIYISDSQKQPAQGTQVVEIVFDTAQCAPGGAGHQIAIVNWTKNY